MKKSLFLLVCGAALSVSSWAQTPAATTPAATAPAAAVSCVTQASDKKLAGAAKNSFVKKCEKDAKAALTPACEAKAVDKNGKALAGAAKTSFIKKCVKDATQAG